VKQKKIRSGKCDLCKKQRDDLECSDGYWLCEQCEASYISGSETPQLVDGGPADGRNLSKGVTQVEIDIEEYFSGEHDDMFDDVVYFDPEEEEFYVDFDDDFDEILGLYYNNLID
jgi:ribosomal protein L37AE/L43A